MKSGVLVALLAAHETKSFGSSSSLLYNSCARDSQSFSSSLSLQVESKDSSDS